MLYHMLTQQCVKTWITQMSKKKRLSQAERGYEWREFTLQHAMLTNTLTNVYIAIENFE